MSWAAVSPRLRGFAGDVGDDGVVTVRPVQAGDDVVKRRLVEVYLMTANTIVRSVCEVELESLVLPEADAAASAGKLISELPRLWSDANLEERRKLLLTMLDAVYVDSKQNIIVAIKPKAPFKPVFSVATTREGSDVVLVHDPDAEPRIADQPPPHGQGAEADSCSWWRRGRVELHPEHGTLVLLAGHPSVEPERKWRVPLPPDLLW